MTRECDLNTSTFGMCLNNGEENARVAKMGSATPTSVFSRPCSFIFLLVSIHADADHLSDQYINFFEDT